MKLRLTQPGFETYTAQMGVIFFENGLSTTDVLPMDAVRMSAVMGCEWEDGTPSNVSQIYLDNMKTPAPMTEVRDEVAAPSCSIAASVTYSEFELAAIADKSGVAGLRAIADTLGVKGNSIRGLIDGILRVAGQGK